MMIQQTLSTSYPELRIIARRLYSNNQFYFNNIAYLSYPNIFYRNNIRPSIIHIK